MNEPLLTKDFDRLRHEMAEKAIVGRGVRSELVIDAMRIASTTSPPTGNHLGKSSEFFGCRIGAIPGYVDHDGWIDHVGNRHRGHMTYTSNGACNAAFRLSTCGLHIQDA